LPAAAEVVPFVQFLPFPLVAFTVDTTTQVQLCVLLVYATKNNLLYA
jgi:hypothetical protein